MSARWWLSRHRNVETRNRRCGCQKIRSQPRQRDREPPSRPFSLRHHAHHARRSTGSLFACIVTHPMRNARSCAAVMAMGSWKQPDERCYIEQPWAPSLGTKMTPGERTDRKSCLSFRANFPNLKHSAEKRSSPSHQRLWNASGRSYSGTRSPTPAREDRRERNAQARFRIS